MRASPPRDDCLLCTRGPQSKTEAMAPLAARRARHPGPRLLDGPMLFVRTRRDVAELAALVWIGIEVARLFRSKRLRASGL